MILNLLCCLILTCKPVIQQHNKFNVYKFKANRKGTIRYIYHISIYQISGYKQDIRNIDLASDWLIVKFRVHFFKKIQDWILKSKRIQKQILHFYTRQINPRAFGSWHVTGTEEFTLEMDSSVPLMHHDPRDLGFSCLEKKRKIRFWVLKSKRTQSWIL